MRLAIVIFCCCNTEVIVLREIIEKQVVASISAINELIKISISYIIKTFLSHLKHINVVINISINPLRVFNIGTPINITNACPIQRNADIKRFNLTFFLNSIKCDIPHIPEKVYVRLIKILKKISILLTSFQSNK